MPRLVYLLGVGLLLVGGALALTDVLLTPPGVTWENVRRIRTGMTEGRVERLLGGPPRAWRDGIHAEGGLCRVGDWGGPGWDVSVWFGGDGRVVLVARYDAGAAF